MFHEIIAFTYRDKLDLVLTLLPMSFANLITNMYVHYYKLNIATQEACTVNGGKMSYFQANFGEPLFQKIVKFFDKNCAHS